MCGMGEIAPQKVIYDFMVFMTFYDFLWLFECSCFSPTEPSYNPMLFPQPTFVNVNVICLRSIPWGYQSSKAPQLKLPVHRDQHLGHSI